jgi:hypothetical protein
LDARRFDVWIRKMAPMASRRAIVGGALGGGLIGFLARFDVRDAAGKRRKRKRKKKKTNQQRCQAPPRRRAARRVSTRETIRDIAAAAIRRVIPESSVLAERASCPAPRGPAPAAYLQPVPAAEDVSMPAVKPCARMSPRAARLMSWRVATAIPAQLAAPASSSAATPRRSSARFWPEPMAMRRNLSDVSPAGGGESVCGATSRPAGGGSSWMTGGSIR